MSIRRKISMALATVMSIGIVSTGSLAAVVVSDTGGNITGVNDLSVTFNDGSTVIYDVEFKDGTCAELFDGCNDHIGDTPFANSGLGGIANAALSVALGDLSDPAVIRGCSDSAECYITTPTVSQNLTQFGGYTLWIVAGLANDLPLTESFVALIGDDFAQIADRTFAVWTIAGGMMDPPSEVPIPGAIPLMLSGLAGIGFMRKKKKSGHA